VRSYSSAQWNIADPAAPPAPARRQAVTLNAVTDELAVVTVTYSPGPHLERFLSSLAAATDRTVSVVMADNGSTDGTPEAAVGRYRNTRLLHTGANLGYGSAVNRAVASLAGEGSGCSEFLVIANPDVVWGPGSIDNMLAAAARWPYAGSLGPLIRNPDGSVYPSARHLPSLVRGGMHAVVGPVWKNNPWTKVYRQEQQQPSERPVGWLSGSCLLMRRAAFAEIGGFDERYFMYMEDVDLGDRLGRAGWLNVYVPSAEILHDKGHSTGRDPARNLARHHVSTYTYLADRYPGWPNAPLRAIMKAALVARARLAVRRSRKRLER
jgi:N-acetylglucosaminyl-diphospho-decaprenol L-rhamnosyltransferase